MTPSGPTALKSLPAMAMVALLSITSCVLAVESPRRLPLIAALAPEPTVMVLSAKTQLTAWRCPPAVDHEGRAVAAAGDERALGGVQGPGNDDLRGLLVLGVQQDPVPDAQVERAVDGQRLARGDHDRDVGPDVDRRADGPR